MTVADVMTREVVGIEPDSTVRELTKLLNRSGVSGVPVMAGGKPVGVVSKTDLTRTPSQDHVVGAIMTPYVHAASEDATLTEVSSLMLERQIHRVLVMRGEEVVGLVSSLDLIRGLRQEMIQIIDAHSARS